MNPRERKLAIATGLLVAIWLGYWLVTQLVGDDPRGARIAELEPRIEQRERQLERVRASKRRLDELAQRALAADPQAARAAYQAWLFERLDRSGLRQWSVDPLTARGSAAGLDLHGFSIRGQGTLAELTALLAEFRRVDYLHVIRQIQVRPIEGRRELDLTLVAQAASLPSVKSRAGLPTAPHPRASEAEIDTLTRAIVERNMFGPPNRPPQLASIGTRRISLGESLALEPSASDPDPLDKLVWSLGEGKETPAGARIDAKTGQVGWTPRAVGSYTLEIGVRDDGLPSLAARERVTVVVSEPPPKPVAVKAPRSAPKSDFDAARFAYVISTIQLGPDWQMWLLDRTTGKIEKHMAGETLEIGSVKGTIVRISAALVVLEVDGRQTLVAIGENLTEGTPLSVEAEAGEPNRLLPPPKSG